MHNDPARLRHRNRNPGMIPFSVYLRRVVGQSDSWWEPVEVVAPVCLS